MFCIMRKRVYFCCLLFLLALFIQGFQGFFIKHSMSGLCLQPASQYRVKGDDNNPNIYYRRGPLYVVHFYKTCLHPDAQFRFFEPFFVLHNIGKNGTFLARDPSQRGSIGYEERFHIYHSPIPPAENVFIYQPKFALKQTVKGALKLNNGYCPTPVKPRTNPKRPRIPKDGDEVYHTMNCDMDDQRFIFGSVTCEGNMITNVGCHRDQVMVIQNAVYGGRSDMKTCGYNENTDCTVPVTCVVKRHCDGKQKCSINVNKTLFDIDPCSGKPKYLYFEFICTDSEPVTVKYVFISNVKLLSSVFPNEGYLEITINNNKNKVCDRSFNNKGKEVVCRQLGYQGINLKMSSDFVDSSNSDSFIGNINCSGAEQMLSHCCVTEPTAYEDCSQFASVSCLICSAPLLEDRGNFPDSIFTALNFIDNHTPEKARLSSNSSWCTSSNVDSYLDIDLGAIYVINSVTIFGDAVSANWVTSYKLSYTGDGKNWINGIAGTNKEIPGNRNAYNDASTTELNGVRARVLRFIPISSHGKRCMRVEICGYKLLPDQVRKPSLIKISSSSVTFSWIPPIIDKGGAPILYYRIKIQEMISGFVVLNFNHTIKINKRDEPVLSPYTEYKLSIAAGNVYGIGKENIVVFSSAETAPSGPPRDVTVVAKSFSSLSASWKEPAKNKQNGVITNYTVCISQFKYEPCLKKRTTVYRTLIIDKLMSSTRYFVRVLASTKVGNGNFSESKARFTNAKPPQQPSGGTLNTLLCMFEIPSSNYSYFKVIALKLSDGKPPSSSPDSYSENDLVTYAEAKSSSQPKPYIAAVVKMSNDVKGEFKLGDGGSSIVPTRRRRRSCSGSYHNGPLDPGTSYSVFQRVYKDKDNYYSTDWSPSTETVKLPVTTPSATAGSKTPLYIVIAISWVIIAVLIVVVVYQNVCRPRSHSPKAKDKVITNINNKSFSGDTYEEVQLPPSSSKDQHHENTNSNASNSQYEELQHDRKHEDDHNYQSLQKTT